MRMAVFQIILKCFAIMGIHSNQLTKKHLFNAKNVLVLIIFASSSVAAHIFLWFKAETFVEYGDSSYETSCATVSSVNFAVVFWKMPQLFQFVEHLESFIAKSE